MKHMKMRWRVCPVTSDDGGEDDWVVMGVERPLTIAKIYGGCYGDDTGEATARAICEEHNAGLDGNKYRDALVALVNALDKTPLGRSSDCPMPHEYDAAKALIQEAP